MQEWHFNLQGFEPAEVVSPPHHNLERRCFILAKNNNQCDLLLADAQGLVHLLFQHQLEQLPYLAVDSEQYLGLLEGVPLWVLVVEGAPELESLQWLGLRSQLGKLSEDAFNLAARALQMAQWQYDHRFCGRCGRSTAQDSFDRAKVCASCQLRFYPRISPCMIVLVTRGDELLLAHHGRATRQVYTTLAGFVEAGERLEDAVHREIMEEVGIKVKHLEYFKSQPWPFPNQLMLGFFASYLSGAIRVDGKEILDAKWFRYDQLPEVSSVASVAGQLIQHFVEQRRALQLES